MKLSVPTLLLTLLAPTLLAPALLAQTPAPKPAPGKEPAQQEKANEDKAKDEKAKPAADRVDFAAQIWPILEARCTECHTTPKAGPDGRVKKPKGGVILDTKDGMLASKRGKLVVAGKPEESLLYTPLVLPADDEDRMPPPKAKVNTPLPKEQTDLIARWIREGGDFGAWTGLPAAEGDASEKPAGKTNEKAGEKPAEKTGEKPATPPKTGK
jgi:uncharacterized membrane protein